MKVTLATSRACDLIERGDFETAGKVINNSYTPDDPSMVQLKQIVDDYNTLVASREKLKKETYEEKIAELDELTLPEDANGISEFLSAVTAVIEYADDKQKDSLLKRGMFLKVIDMSIAKAKEFEAEGNWVDAYAHCYYWLTAIYKDNKEHKQHSDDLTEKAMIALSLEDNSCQTSVERHEGIKAAMLVRAIGKLDFSYVSIVDYSEMTSKALKRCRLLSEVLALPDEDINYKLNNDKLHQWNDGLSAIESGIEGSVVSVSRDKFVVVFDSILALNSVSINIPQEVLIAQFSEAALTGLDPFTTLVWPWQVSDFQKSMTQEFIGIGVEISKATGALKVASLLPFTPAYTSDLDADDEIVAVNGELTEDMSIGCAVSKITGPKGTDVTLTIRHAGADETVEITITRDKIIVPTIRGWQRAEEGRWLHFVDPANGIGYLRVTGFTETTTPMMANVLDRLEREGLKGLIIDLRFNSGGYLRTAAEIVDMFVEDGLIVKSQPRWGISNYEMAHKKNTRPDYPIVVLINSSSASASEIVSGALQDMKFKRATLVGTRSYGKGSVQTITGSTGDNSQLKYTMAYYYLPSNQRVKNRYVLEKEGRDDWGIASDVEIKLRANELRKMFDLQRENDVLAKSGHDETAEPLKRNSLAETLEADLQLHVGLLVVKSKMIAKGIDLVETKVKDKPAAE